MGSYTHDTTVAVKQTLGNAKRALGLGYKVPADYDVTHPVQKLTPDPKATPMNRPSKIYGGTGGQGKLTNFNYYHEDD